MEASGNLEIVNMINNTNSTLISMFFAPHFLSSSYSLLLIAPLLET